MKRILQKKSFEFSIEVIKLVKFLQIEKKEFILSKQLLKSGTSIGAQLWEAEYAQSKAEFLSKISIALKEANETKYWLHLLLESSLINHENASKVIDDCTALLRMLISAVKTIKST